MMSKRRATIRTRHANGELATQIGATLRPDNTEEMRTSVDGDRLETTIERSTTGGLAATVDDYVVNLSVAVQVANDTTHTTYE